MDRYGHAGLISCPTSVKMQADLLASGDLRCVTELELMEKDQQPH